MRPLADLLWLFILAMFRFSPLFLLPEISPFSRLPIFAKLTLLAVLSILLVLALPGNLHAVLPQSYVGMASEFVIEFLMGLALAFALYLAFAVLRFYGQQIDLQIGFGAAGILDPSSGQVGSVFGSALAFIATMLFFIWGFQRDLILGMAASLRTVPLGSGTVLHQPGWLVTLLNRQFLFGFIVVAPIAVGLFLLDVLIAYASRLMPQANIYFLALPVKIGAGLLLMAFSLRYVGPTTARLIEHGFDAWRDALGS